MTIKNTPLALLLVLLSLSTVARAEVPAYVPFQGFLTDADGVPVDGVTDITFSIYDQEVGGTPLFTETRTVDLENGFLNVFIGSVNTLEPSVFDRAEVYLGVKVNADSEMIDRTRLASVPYAFFANQCMEAATLEGMPASAFAPATPAWSSIASRPSGLDDGDDDTKYTAGTGMNLSGGGAFSVDTGYVQRRVSASCAAGSAIRAIASDGTVTCEPDDDTVSDTEYTAANNGGLALSGSNAFSIAPDGVTGSMIADNAVGNDQIATGAVGGSEIADNAVGLDELGELPGGSQRVVQALGDGPASYDLLAASFTPSDSARCLVTASLHAEHDGNASAPVTFVVLASNGGDRSGVSGVAAALPVEGQALTTTAMISASVTISAASTAFGCRAGVPGQNAYDDGTVTCDVSWVCF